MELLDGSALIAVGLHILADHGASSPFSANISDMTQVTIHPTWAEALQEEFQKPYFAELTAFVKQEYATHNIFPPGKDIFRAFDRCPLPQVQVVILGQDPYHGPGQANGLCFSVHEGIALPPSLQNIFKEISSDLSIPRPVSGDLDRWADQGVLLLNSTLSVRAGLAGSHQRKGWERFTDAVIRVLAARRTHVVYLLWGRYAQDKGALLDPTQNCILKAPHPSPLSAHAGFLGCKHFSQANAYLTATHQAPIDWH